MTFPDSASNTANSKSGRKKSAAQVTWSANVEMGKEQVHVFRALPGQAVVLLIHKDCRNQPGPEATGGDDLVYHRVSRDFGVAPVLRTPQISWRHPWNEQLDGN